MSTASSAKLIGSLLFCPVCSTLLDLPGDKDVIVCEQCSHEEPAQCAYSLSSVCSVCLSRQV
jgi:primosomal protein N'